jgi:putative ABC transport system substrate-binding protein
MRDKRATATVKPRVSAIVLLCALAMLACDPIRSFTTPQQSGLSPAAQPSTPAVIRVGYITPGQADERSPTKDAFLEGFGAEGYREGENLAMEYRFLGQQSERAREFAQELAAIPVDVIVTVGTPSAQAARRATNTIPVVMLNVSDPVQAGLVESISRPGTNVTGMSTVSGVLASKRLEVLKEAVPSVRRVAVISSPRWKDETASAYRQWVETQAAAPRLGLEIFLVEAQEGASLPDTARNMADAFTTATAQRPDAVTVLGDALVDVVRTDIARLAKQHRLVSMHTRADFIDAGGMLAYGPDLLDQARRAAGMVDRLVKGASPADLPVELPSVFELAVNLRTASELGVEISPGILAQATKVVR